MGGSPAAAGQKKLGRFARRPAVGAAVALMVGIALHSSVPDRPAVWLAMAAGVAVAAGGIGRWAGGVANVLLALAVMGVGVSVGRFERYHFRADDIVRYTTDAARLAEVEMEIDQPPRVLTQNSPAGRPLPPRQVTGGVVKRVKTLDGWREASGNILLQINPPKADLAYGQRVAVMGMLSQPAPAMNPGQFDWQRYYREQRILVSIDAPNPANVRILAPGGFAPINWLRER